MSTPTGCTSDSATCRSKRRGACGPCPGKRFGLSTHNEREALLASHQSPDYIGVGPVFATPTKAIPDPVLGPERMGAIIRSVPVPAVALGGIDLGNLAEVLRNGARNFCVVRAVTRRPDPETAIRELQDIWRQETGSADDESRRGTP